MAGGKPEVFARIKPLFDLMGKTVLHVGPTGAGQITKACNQMVMVAAIEAVAEAAHLAAANNVDFAKVVGAMQSGSAGSRVQISLVTRWRGAISPPASRRDCITRITP
jgi:2-hydroxy-3-oxopropionate reductase